MSCEQNQTTITESLAAGSELPRTLHAHLDSCAACRASFERERALFAAIDSGLHLLVGEELPGGFAERARARLAEQPDAARARVSFWAAVALPAAAVLALAVTLWIRRDSPEPGERTGIAARQTPSPVAQPPAPAQNVRPAGQLPSSRRAARSFPGAAAPRGEPEVLVAAGDQEAFANYVKLLRQTRDLVVAVADQNGDPLEIVPLKVDELQITPLEGTEANPGSRR